MKKAVPVIIALSLIFVIAFGVFGYQYVERYIPTKEPANLTEVYGVDGDRVAVFYDYERQRDVEGIYENDQMYLPISWVNEMLNERFYWDSTENLLVYTLPDQIVYADAQTMGSNGAPLLLERDGEVYLVLGLIANYTDVEIHAFDSDDAKRVFVTSWGERETAVTKKDGSVRVKGGIKSPVLTKLEKASEVVVLDTMENWSKVMTKDGHIGYIKNTMLDGQKTELFESYRKPVEYTSTHLDEKIVLGWHQVTSMEMNDKLDEVLEKTEGVNVISPTWFALTDNEGNFSSLASKEYVEKAHERGLQVWALLNNFSSDVQSEILLSSTTTRRKLINNLMEAVETYDLDGLNMDFEGLKEAAGVHYIQFLRELSIPCREKGIVLSVDNYVPTSYNGFYEREEQGVVVDYVIIMGYDEHTAGGEAGSVASLEFVSNGIQNTLKSVPKEKVINAVPFYTRIWTGTETETKAKAYGIKAAKKWIEENQIELYWQAELGQYYGEMEGPSGLSRVWMEEENSLKLKMDLVKSYDLAGVACWKLGLEDEAAWDAISWK